MLFRKRSDYVPARRAIVEETIEARGGSLVVPVGWWILGDSRENFSILKDSVFRNEYAAIDGAGEAEMSKEV